MRLAAYRCSRSRSLSTLALPLQHTPQPDHLFQSNKKIVQLCRLGRVTEARKLFDAMIQRDAVTWNSMITGYAQNGRMDEARLLFDAFAGKNVRTWTAMLTGYAKNRRIEEANRVFESMPERNIVSWNAMIGGYVENGDLCSARRLFDQMLERNITSWNSIITGYCQFCLVVEARELFDQMPEKNSVSWAVMINGYVKINHYRAAWGLFLRMHSSGIRPDQSTFVIGVSVVAGLNDFALIESLRTLVIKTGSDRDVVVSTAILDVYTRCGCLDIAMQFFQSMPELNEYSWTTMIAALSQFGRFDDAILLYERIPQKNASIQTAILSAYAQSGRIGKARQIFDEIPTPNVVAWNAIVSGYVQNCMPEEAKDLFLRIPCRNSASWGAMIAGLVQNGLCEEALELFAELHRSRAVPSHSSFTSALSACSSLGALDMGRQIHTLSIKTGCQFNSYVGNRLLSLYAKCKQIEDATRVFSRMRLRDIVSWNSLIACFSENRMLDHARNTFEKMPERDVVSWTTIISAYVQAGHGEVALQFFYGMLGSGIKPNELTVTSLLSTCGTLGASKLGEQIHGMIYKFGFHSCIRVCNSLITMYFKCGREDGFSVFGEMGEQDVATWNALLVGCAEKGFDDKAFEIFERMKAKGVVPDQISFMGILCACSHSGLVDEGLSYFKSMSQEYGIMPSRRHFTCMVDLLGRAGWLSEAESLVKNMPVEPDQGNLEALGPACKIHCMSK